MLTRRKKAPIGSTNIWRNETFEIFGCDFAEAEIFEKQIYDVFCSFGLLISMLKNFRNNKIFIRALYECKFSGRRNCQEPACRRTRGCVAPGGDCPQLPPLPPDPDGEREAQAVADFYKALKAEAARRGLDEDAIAPASHVPSSRRGRPRGSE
jgi:hypothetical protein